MQIRNASASPAVTLTLLLLLVLIGVGCTRNESPEEIREKTASATANLKQNAKAVAQGVREGWSRDKPLDLNKATKGQLQDLPGITEAQADQIVAARPFYGPQELVSRRIVTQDQYARISDRVVAKH